MKWEGYVNLDWSKGEDRGTHRAMSLDQRQLQQIAKWMDCLLDLMEGVPLHLTSELSLTRQVTLVATITLKLREQGAAPLRKEN